MTLFHYETDRMDYGSLLKPDEGYSVEFAVAFTYSLDLEALLGVPLSLTMAGDMDSGLSDSPHSLLTGIIRCSDRLAIFCNAGCIAIPRTQREQKSIFALLEKCVFEIRFEGTKNFHPKLWFIKYSSADNTNAPYIRLIVLSRNLTFDRSLDYAVALTGKVTGRVYKKNAPLVDMLQFVAQSASKEQGKKIRKLAKEVLTTNFRVEDPFDDYACIPFGLGGDTSPKTIFGECDDLVVISPFLEISSKNTFLKELTKLAKRKKALFTRKDSLTQEIIDLFSEVYIVEDALLEQDGDGEEDPSPSPCDLHAKLYFTHSGDRNCLYVGSANASHKGFFKNIEFLLRLQFKRQRMGYELLKKSLSPETGSPFMKISRLDEDTSSAAESLQKEKDFKDAMRSITGATAIMKKKSECFSLTIHAKPCRVGASLSLLCSTKKLEPLRDGLVFEGLSQEELSEFFILQVEDRKAVIKVPVKGIPDTRDQAVYRSIIRDKDDFMAYVSFMLPGAHSGHASRQHKSGEGGDAKHATVPPALYENMLEYMVENPRQVLELEDVMKRLGEEDDHIFQQFKPMFTAFKEAAKKRHV